MGNHVLGIITIVLLSLFIVVVLGLSYRDYQALEKCRKTESPFCLTMTCAKDGEDALPCRGYAKRPGEKEGTWYCSSSPQTLVDDKGKIISQN